MKIFEYKNDNFNLKVVCDSFETRNAWGHNANVVFNGNEIPCGNCKRIYYNRTWERYKYQSVLLGAILNCLDWYDEMNIKQFKDTNGIKRMTKKRKEEYRQFEGAFDEHIDFFQTVYNYFYDEYK